MAIHKLESSFAKVDSSDETMDCRADKSARNDNLLDSSKSLLLSSRADTIGVAIHNSALAESNQINSAHKVRNLESVQGVWGVKGGIRGDASQVAPLSPLEKNLSQTRLESSKKAQKVDSMDCHEVVPTSRNDRKTNPCEKPDSSTNTLSPSSRAVCQHGVAIHKLESSFAKVDSRNALFANAKSMDCHANASAFARNDDENAVFQKVDSKENAQSLNEPQAEAVEMRNRCFQAVGAGIYLSGNEQAHRAESAIYRSNATPLSPKAESPLKVAYAAA